MRALPAMSLLFLAGTIGSALIADARADSIKTAPNLTTFSKDQARSDDNSPTVLCGSATRRGTVRNEELAYEPARFELGAGAKLWLADPESGRVVVCDERRTSRVGSRFVGCIEDRLPYAIAK